MTLTNLPQTDDVLVVKVSVTVLYSVMVRVAAGPNCRFWGAPKILESNFGVFCALAEDSTTDSARTMTVT